MRHRLLGQGTSIILVECIDNHQLDYTVIEDKDSFLNDIFTDLCIFMLNDKLKFSKEQTKKVGGHTLCTPPAYFFTAIKLISWLANFPQSCKS